MPKIDVSPEMIAALAALAGQVTADEPTLGYLWPLYAQDQEHEVDSWGTKDGRMRLHVLPWFGRMRPRDVTLARCREYRLHRLGEDSRVKGKDGKAKKTSEKTIDNELQDLRRLMSWARKMNRITVNTMAGVDKNELFSKHKSARVSIYEAPTVPEILEALEGLGGYRAAVMRAFFLVALSSGMRRGEIATLTWPQVDSSQGIIQIWTSKNREPRETVFDDLAQRALDQVRERQKVRGTEGKWVFMSGSTGKPIHRDTFTAWFREAMDEAGLEGPDGNYWLHDCRHTFVTELDRAGVNMSQGMDLTGHKTDSMYRWYKIRNRENTLRAKQKLADLKSKK